MSPPFDEGGSVECSLKSATPSCLKLHYPLVSLSPFTVLFFSQHLTPSNILYNVVIYFIIWFFHWNILSNGRVIFCFGAQLHLKWCLAHSRHSINICCLKMSFSSLSTHHSVKAFQELCLIHLVSIQCLVGIQYMFVE